MHSYNVFSDLQKLHICFMKSLSTAFQIQFEFVLT